MVTDIKDLRMARVFEAMLHTVEGLAQVTQCPQRKQRLLDKADRVRTSIRVVRGEQ